MVQKVDSNYYFKIIMIKKSRNWYNRSQYFFGFKKLLITYVVI